MATHRTHAEDGIVVIGSKECRAVWAFGEICVCRDDGRKQASGGLHRLKYSEADLRVTTSRPNTYKHSWPLVFSSTVVATSQDDPASRVNCYVH